MSPSPGATPYVQQYNLTLQSEMPFGMVSTVSYVGALGRKQYIFNGGVNVNLASPGPGTIQPRRPYYSLFPNVSGISIAAPWYNTSYQGLQTTLERRYSNGLSLVAKFTWAHSIDNEPAILNRSANRAGRLFPRHTTPLHPPRRLRTSLRKERAGLRCHAGKRVGD